MNTKPNMSSVIFITKTGDDGTGDGSAGNPYLTITQGITVANPGDEISVGDGYLLGVSLYQ
jgi:hypothetical protein